MATIEVAGTDEGATISAAVGDTIVLRLPDNPTTGYQWELDPLPGTGLVAVESGFEPTSDLMGSGGTATWALQAQAPGTTVVRLKRWRQWEGESSVLERLVVTVTVER